jgi:hypothetical protein
MRDPALFDPRDYERQDKLTEALQRLRGLLRPGGALVFTVPVYDTPVAAPSWACATTRAPTCTSGRVGGALVGQRQADEPEEQAALESVEPTPRLVRGALRPLTKAWGRSP